jgi:prolyl-tRNA editing enzyme YbaK/EbsC (Cys-tRNA(Pro) deacylase)
MEHKQSLSKSAQSVQNALDQKGIQTAVVELPASTRTAQDAAQTIGCQIDQIVKSLVFKTKDSNTPILILASGPNRVNEALIEAVIGEKIVRSDADFVREVTGFAIGGIPPMGHKQPLKTFIDEDLMKLQELWAAAGTPNAVFSLKADDLQALTQGIVIAIH